MKTCPFKNEVCNADCALYIAPDELNELVLNRLASLGILPKDSGICSFKTAALCADRFIFENTATKRS